MLFLMNSRILEFSAVKPIAVEALFYGFPKISMNY